MSDIKDRRLPADGQKLVFMTRMVAASRAGVNDRTFEKYAVPSAWRRERDGGLSALYDGLAVEAFCAAYRPKTSGGAG